MLSVLFKKLDASQRLLAQDVAVGQVVDCCDEVSLLAGSDEVENLVCEEDRVCVSLVLDAAMHRFPERLDQGLFIDCGAAIHLT